MKSVYYYLSIAFILIAGCEQREINFIENNQFLLSAVLSQDFLILEEAYNLTVDIRLQDSSRDDLSYRLHYTIHDGSATLLQNGFPFESGDEISLDDQWSIQPLTLGSQSIEISVSDNTGVQKAVALTYEVGEFIPVDFSFAASFTESEVILGSDTELQVNLSTDDQNMAYHLNYLMVEGDGEIQNSAAEAIGPDHPIKPGSTRFIFKPSVAGNNVLKLIVTDSNEEKASRNLSVFVIDQIPFTISVSASPQKLRQSKSSTISVAITSSHPLFETLSFSMDYSSNFKESRLFDDSGLRLVQESPASISRSGGAYTYQPVAAGDHIIQINVADQKGNFESASVIINSVALQPPLVKAEVSFRLTGERCVPLGFGGLEDCTQDLQLVVDMAGSVDQDSDLGGFIEEYKIIIEGRVYEGEFNPDNPTVTISNGKASYTRSIAGAGEKTYSGVRHQPGAGIEALLTDDDELRSIKKVLVPALPN